MTKADVVHEISTKTGIHHRNVNMALESFVDVIKTSMEDGHEIFIRGFGSFIIIKRAEKLGRNIATNTAVLIPEHYIPKFKPSPEFKEKVKNGKMKVADKKKA